MAEPLQIVTELQNVPVQPGPVAGYLKQLSVNLRASESGEGKAAVHIVGKTNVDAFSKAIDGIYYDAKNRVYREDTYFHELSDIAERMNFTRSLTLLCFWFAVLYALVGLSACIPVAAKFLDIDPTERRTVFLLCVLFVVGVWFARSAYRSESIAYDVRVFGYYISLGNKELASDERNKGVSR